MTDLPYVRAYPNAYEWTEKAFDLLVSKRLDGEVHRRHGLEAASVAGVCPRCDHQFRFGSSKEAVGTGGRTLQSDEETIDADEYVPVDVRCMCTGEHPGRQKDEKGCGITFRIEVRPLQHDD